MTLDVRNDLDKHQRKSVQNITYFDILEKDNLLCVSRASSKESWITFLISQWRLDDFGCHGLP